MSKITKVLIIDDDSDDRQLFCEAIGNVDSKIDCVEAINGAEALSILRKLKDDLPSLIFLDLDMPIMNGWETLNCIRAMDFAVHIQVILYSSVQMHLTQAQPMQGQFSFFWVKPDSYGQIVKTLSLILGGQAEDIADSVEGVPGIFRNS